MNELSHFSNPYELSAALNPHSLAAGPMPFSHANEENLLLLLAAPLITLMTTLRHTTDQKDVLKFRVQMIQEIKNFEAELKQVPYPMQTILAARYCLCTAIDEAVLSRDWGTASPWVQGTLLSYFHRETWGGERFYIIVEELAKEPAINIDFLEFSYCILSLGFEGKFYGPLELYREDLRNRLFQRIRFSRQKPDKSLSPHWRTNLKTAENTSHRRNLKKIGACLLVIVVIYNVIASLHAQSTFKKLDSLATTSPVTIFGDMISRPLIERES